jgi:hypothetical protein
LLAGEVVDDATSFARVILTRFANLRQGLRWLREAGISEHQVDEDCPSLTMSATIALNASAIGDPRRSKIARSCP